MADQPDLTKEFSEGAPVDGFAHHAEDITADREPYGPPGLRGLMTNPFVLMCAACSTLGGLVFGYDQGVVSVILVMDQFLEQFPRVGGAGAGFWKGLLTAMIELGALLGALNQGWIADRISRRYSIIVAVVIFTIGSVLQTAAVDYAMLTVARLIGGVGIGMLSMVAPLYISEISMYMSFILFVTVSEINLVAIRSCRMPWYAASARRMVHCARDRHCLLDHVRHSIHGRRMVLASALPPPDDSRFYPCRRCHYSPFLASLAGFEKPQRRSHAKPVQAAQPASYRPSYSSGVSGHSSGGALPPGNECREASKSAGRWNEELYASGAGLVGRLLQEGLLAPDSHWYHDLFLPAGKFFFLPC